jgi:hypothetical protein
MAKKKLITCLSPRCLCSELIAICKSGKIKCSAARERNIEQPQEGYGKKRSKSKE